jgi:hypothetical protein
VRHQLELALHREQQKKFTLVDRIDLPFLVVICENGYYLLRLPLKLEHDLNKIYETDVAVFHRLRSAASKHYFFNISRSSVEFCSVFDALFDEVLLAVRQHLANHFPCYLD